MDVLQSITIPKLDLLLGGEKPPHDILPELTTPTRRLLLWALQSPMTAVDLARHTGLPLMLVEEELDGLCALEAVRPAGKDALATSFYIETLAYQAKLAALVDSFAPGLLAALRDEEGSLRTALADLRIDMGAGTLENCLPTYIVHLLHDCVDYGDYAPPVRPQGSRYYFNCHAYADGPRGLAVYDWYDGIQGLWYRTCVPSNTSVMRRIGADGRKITAACKQLHEEGNLAGYDEEFIASLVAAGVLARKGDGFALAVPWLTQAQFAQFEALAKGLGRRFAPQVSAYRAEVAALLQAEVPAHLRTEQLIHVLRALSLLMLRAMLAYWPEDAPDAAGLMFVEADA